MQVMTQFSIFLVNKPGVLASVTGALSKAKVNILALTLTDSVEQGVLRLICDDPSGAREMLGKTYDRWTETDVLVMDLLNKPGAFSHVAQKLADSHVNISYAYCTGGAPGGRTKAVFKVADLKKAQKILAAERPQHKDSAGAIKPPPSGRRRR